MKKKIGIITINDNDNYGNRLQNYATSVVIEKLGNEAITIKNSPRLNKRTSRKTYLKKILSYIYHEKIKILKKKDKERKKCFDEFNKNMKFTCKTYTIYSKIDKKFDYFITGSDQVWKPTYGRLSDMDLLDFTNKNKKIAFAASFGVSCLEQKDKEFAKEKLKDFKAISVREDTGKQIVEELTGRTDVEVIVDPTMLLSAEEWDKVTKKPEQLKNDRYILNYFLGELSSDRKNEIERIAKENDCEIINILDKNSPFYRTGPSEFLYLEKNAFLICTDSFHSSVFAIIYNKPFIVFEREDNKVNMNSRIETLLNKFMLQDRKYNGQIAQNLLEHDYTNSYKILAEEKEKAKQFIYKAMI